MKTIKMALTIVFMATGAFAQVVGNVVLAIPAETQPDELLLVKGMPTAVVGKRVEILDVTPFCSDPTPAGVKYTVGEMTFKVTFANNKLSSGKKSVAYSCPLKFTAEDQSAADFASAHFSDRLHDKSFFTEADRDTGMLPAIAEGLKLTGPEWFDGFTVHKHDGAAISQIFTDARANVMAYRFVTSDGRRAYLAVPRSSLSCSDKCTLGGAEMIFLHASKNRKQRVKKTLTDIGTLPTIVCKTCGG